MLRQLQTDLILTRRCLSIGKYSAIEAFDSRFHNGLNEDFKNLPVGGVRAEDMI